MASVFFGHYHVEYSIVDGAITATEKLTSLGTYAEVDDPEERRDLYQQIAVAQGQCSLGYSAFLYPLAEQGIVDLQE